MNYHSIDIKCYGSCEHVFARMFKPKQIKLKFIF